MTTESEPAFVSKPAPPGYRYAGPLIRLAAQPSITTLDTTYTTAPAGQR